MTIKNNIIINAGSDSKFLELICDEATGIIPGMCVQRWEELSGYYAKRTSGPVKGQYPLIIAVEDLANGHTVYDTYAQGDTMLCRYLRPGDVFYGIHNDGESVDSGEPVAVDALANPGYFVWADGANALVGVALEYTPDTIPAYSKIEVL